MMMEPESLPTTPSKSNLSSTRNGNKHGEKKNEEGHDTYSPSSARENTDSSSSPSSPTKSTTTTMTTATIESDTRYHNDSSSCNIPPSLSFSSPSPSSEGEGVERESSSSAEAASDKERRGGDEAVVADDEMIFSLSFTNYIDMQTRLVLLPLRDDECVGAVVASFQPPTPTQRNNDGGGGSAGEMAGSDGTGGGGGGDDGEETLSCGDDDLSVEEEDRIDEDQETTTAQVVVGVDEEGCSDHSHDDDGATDPIPLEEWEEGEEGHDEGEKEAHNLPQSAFDSQDSDLLSIDVDETDDDSRSTSTNTNDDDGEQRRTLDGGDDTITKDGPYIDRGALFSPLPPPCDVVGAVLIGIPDIDDDGNDDDMWSNTDFTSILAAIRGVSSSSADDGAPIVLLFRRSPKKNRNDDRISTAFGNVDYCNDDVNKAATNAGGCETSSSNESYYTTTSSSGESIEDDTQKATVRQSSSITNTNANANTATTTNVIKGKLKGWGSRMKEQAGEAAARAKLAMEASRAKKIEHYKQREEEEQKRRRQLQLHHQKLSLQQQQQQEQQLQQRGDASVHNTNGTISDNRRTSPPPPSLYDDDDGVHVPSSIAPPVPSSSSHRPPQAQPPSPSPSLPICGLYLQTTSGKCLPLQPPNSNYINSTSSSSPSTSSSASDLSATVTHNTLSSPTTAASTISSSISLFLNGPTTHNGSNGGSNRSPPRVTNTSVLVVRTSADQPCPIDGTYTYRWYRSAPPTPPSPSSSFSSSSSRSSSSSTSSNEQEGRGGGLSSCASGDGERGEGGWVELKGAKHFIFQPSATDVGHALRCVVTVVTNDDDARIGKRIVAVIECDMVGKIEADLTLFRAALRGFVVTGEKGASFTGFLVEQDHHGDGDDNAEMKRVELRITVFMVEDRNGRKRGKTRGVYRLLFDRIVNGVAEPLHDVQRPIDYVISASADPSNPKLSSLYFSSGLIESIPQLSSLCSYSHHPHFNSNDDRRSRRLLLQAPSRLFRESFLLALGVAMYSSNRTATRSATSHSPNTRSVLFPSVLPARDDGVNEEEDDDDYNRTIITIGDSSPPINNPAVIITNPQTLAGVPQSLPPSHHDKHGPTPSSTNTNTNTNTNIQPTKPPTQTSTIDSNTSNMNMVAIESALENDIILLRKKLESKHHTVIELQRCLVEEKEEGKRMEMERADCYRSLRLAEKRIESLQSDLTRTKRDFFTRTAQYESESQTRSVLTAEHERTLRSLTNEKAVLTAAIEARDAKLERTSELQSEVESLRREVLDSAIHKNRLAMMEDQHEKLQIELTDVRTSEFELKHRIGQLEESESKNVERLKSERTTSARYRRDAELAVRRCTDAKAEAKSYKQRADSLAREMSRILGGGTTIRTVDDVVEILKTYTTSSEEIASLRAQRRGLEEELEGCRTAYGNLVDAHREVAGSGSGRRSSGDVEFLKTVERRQELEKVVEGLTEYVEAKEMQIGTMREVNRSLEEEVRRLARDNLSKNDL